MRTLRVPCDFSELLMLNSLSSAATVDAASRFLPDVPGHGSDVPRHLGEPRPVGVSSADRATQTSSACQSQQTDQAHALFEKIFGGGAAWLDARERSSMISALAAVGLAMKGFHGAEVVVHAADANDLAPPYVERPNARSLHVVHADGGSTNDVMVTTTSSLRVRGDYPPVGWGGFSAEGVAKALCVALTPPPAGRKDFPSPRDVDDFKNALRSAMRRLVEDEPATLLHLARRAPVKP